MENIFEKHNLAEAEKNIFLQKLEESVKVAMAREAPRSKEEYEAWFKAQKEEMLKREVENDYVVESKIAEEGLFAKHDFQVGDLISEGLISRYEKFPNAFEVEEDPDLAHNVIQIGVGEKGEGLYVGVPRQHPRNFVNHSCDPNAGIKIVDMPDGTKNSLLLAIKKIKKDEEVVIDYGTVQFEKWTLEGCNCGQPNCRGKMTDFGGLPEELQEKYIALKLIPDYALKWLGRKE